MELTKKQLKYDLYKAFYDARKHKSSKDYVKEFEKNLDENIDNLCESLFNRTYIPELLDCFIIECPKPREIYAAKFTDRIVQHLYYNYTHEFFEKTFIADSYSCIKNRGTSYGINRLKHHILSESQNYTKKCYYLKIDIRGYFMHINREILLDEVYKTLNKYEKQYTNLDFDFLRYLSKEIISLDVTSHCSFKGITSYYKTVPINKILAFTKSKYGMPIGNLTSQLFSNVYLNIFDQFMKRILKCKHYGRYVDDAYVISCDKKFLLSIIPKIEMFLRNRLELELHKGKLILKDVSYGVEFLGAYIKQNRTYISNQSLRRMRNYIYHDIGDKNKEDIITSRISRIGILSQYDSTNIKNKIFNKL